MKGKPVRYERVLVFDFGAFSFSFFFFGQAKKKDKAEGKADKMIFLRPQKNRLIHDNRIEEVKSQLDNDAYKNTSVLKLALDSGFKANSSFNTIFKQYILNGK